MAEISISKWEEENAPYKMPDDFKAFLQISDGLALNWKIKKNEMTFNLGAMHLNKLREIKRIRDERYRFANMVDQDDSDDDDFMDSGEERYEPLKNILTVIIPDLILTFVHVLYF